MRRSDRPDGLPKNEGELLLLRPRSYELGAFPRRLLLPGERVIFEARPHRQPQGILGWSVAVLFALSICAFVPALGFAIANPGSFGGALAGDLAILAGLGVLLFGPIFLLQWVARGSTAFALTDRRVLYSKRRWTTEFRFAEWREVERLVRPTGGSDRIVFEARTTGGSRESIEWTGLREPVRTYEFAQSAFALEIGQAAIRQREEERTRTLLTGRVVCAYCGNIVSAAGMEPPERCPRCSAPLPSIRIPTPSVAVRPEARAVRGAHVPFLRPVVELGRVAVGWYRWLAALWLVAAGLIVGTFAALDLGLASATSALAIGIILLLPVLYVAWALVLRNWWTAVRTISRSVQRDPVWRDRVVRPLVRLTFVSTSALALSLVLLAGAIAAFAAAVRTTGTNGLPDAASLATLSALSIAFVGAVALGHLALLSSFPRVAAGSGVRAVEVAFKRGRSLGSVSLLGMLWPIGTGVVALLLAPTQVPLWVWFLPSGVGPVLLLYALRWTDRGFDRWTFLADRWIPHGPGASGGSTPMDSEPLVEAWSASSLGWRSATSRVACFVISTAFAVGVVGLLISSAMLPPPTSHVGYASAGARILPGPPTVLAKAGAIWSIPSGEFAYEGFRVNVSADVNGSYTSTTPVEGYLMDSNSFAILEINGHPTYWSAATGNGTLGDFNFKLNGSDRYYLVILNTVPGDDASVTWTSACTARYPG